jgi:hypothetical protein
MCYCRSIYHVIRSSCCTPARQVTWLQLKVKRMNSNRIEDVKPSLQDKKFRERFIVESTSANKSLTNLRRSAYIEVGSFIMSAPIVIKQRKKTSYDQRMIRGKKHSLATTYNGKLTRGAYISIAVQRIVGTFYSARFGVYCL